MITLFYKDFFDIANPVFIVEVSFCTENEVYSKQFMRKFQSFRGSKFALQIKQMTTKMETLSKLKYKYLFPTCKIHHAVCSFGETYIGETFKNVEIRQNEY